MFKKTLALPALRSKITLYRGLKYFVENEKFVIVKGHSEDQLKFPGVWLRDNCQCVQCFHPDSKSRSLDWKHFDTNVKIKEIKSDIAKENITIQWNDNHISIFNLDWLKRRSFNKENQDEYLKRHYRPIPVHWNKNDFETNFQSFQYNEVINSDAVLKEWINALAVHGVVLLKNAPLDKDVVSTLATKIGFIRETTYGKVFTVEVKSNAQNVAFLSEELPLHTDLPYYEYKPSVTVLHTLQQSKSIGGANLLVDGFYIADRMKCEYPEHFKRLTETVIDWNDIGHNNGYSYHNIWRTPVICTDRTGNYTRINHNIHQRDSHFNVPLENVIPWYEAYAQFVWLAHEEAVPFKTCPGDVLAFNNIRLLHGRTAYDDTKGNTRCIVGMFLDWDILYSKLRVLTSQ